MKTVIMDIMKRSFTELSKESQIILGVIITIITIWEISAFLNMIERKEDGNLLSLAVGILIFQQLLMQGLADLARGGHMTESVPGRILEKIPFSYGVLLLAFLYGVEYLLWKKKKYSGISDGSVCKGNTRCKNGWNLLCIYGGTANSGKQTNE